MDTAVAGLLGVIAGAVVTGGVQAIGAVWTRRLNSRTAARLLLVTLINAHIALQTVLTHTWWGPPTDDWGRFIAPWGEHREPLMRVLSADDCLGLAAIFSQLEAARYLRAEKHRELLRPGFDPARIDFSATAELLRPLLPRIRAATHIVWKASHPAWKRAKPFVFPATPPADTARQAPEGGGANRL